MTELRHILCVIIFLDCHLGKQIGIPKDVEGQSKIPRHFLDVSFIITKLIRIYSSEWQMFQNKTVLMCTSREICVKLTFG